MFITLRTSSGGQNGTGGMEQVVRRSASQPGKVSRRARPTRRPACAACQTQKVSCVEMTRFGHPTYRTSPNETAPSFQLRCTGSPNNCDRCKARLIECVPSTSTTQNKHQTQSPPSCNSSSLGDASPQPGDASPSSTSLTNGMSRPDTGLSSPVGVDQLDGNLFDLNVFGLDLDMDELGCDTDVQSALGSINSTGSHDTGPLPVTKSLQDASNETEAAGQPNRASSPSCSCLSDLVRVVQQLDDDEFHITTLSLDQVLQLQKWLIFQCCKPLDCPKCLDPSVIDSVRLIVCDRLTEMFECIHRRIRRAGAILAGQNTDSNGTHLASSLSPESQSVPSHHSLDSAPSSAAGPGPASAQLFCQTSGLKASAASCNPMMFSDDFCRQYSDEEQVHMIRALLKLQIRNFHKLLLRVERTSSVVGSQARRSKVKSMMMRLSKAWMDIDAALCVVLQALSIG
ncbi:hypothetical protein N657DRAFT_492248 [Parathielavia appendiculata]|uniref:Zn(2)-C6 fungal-type domain-containing protein n=1 Tax=Parathielavia appendiculata TaxID=2587402 RepID=A0AAN6TYH1_9PEZI|nr:hypothetical protein N657DRAFT_492248 [Parathielavia appendiculata]